MTDAIRHGSPIIPGPANPASDESISLSRQRLSDIHQRLHGKKSPLLNKYHSIHSFSDHTTTRNKDITSVTRIKNEPQQIPIRRKLSNYLGDPLPLPYPIPSLSRISKSPDFNELGIFDEIEQKMIENSASGSMKGDGLITENSVFRKRRELLQSRLRKKPFLDSRKLPNEILTAEEPLNNIPEQFSRLRSPFSFVEESSHVNNDKMVSTSTRSISRSDVVYVDRSTQTENKPPIKCSASLNLPVGSSPLVNLDTEAGSFMSDDFLKNYIINEFRRDNKELYDGIADVSDSSTLITETFVGFVKNIKFGAFLTLFLFIAFVSIIVYYCYY